MAPRLHRGAPSAEIRFDDFAEVFLQRHTGAPRTVATLRDRLAPARATFGDWKLSELEHAANDIAAWRATIPEGSRYRLTNALRQAFAAAVRWRYITRNPAVDMGPNPQPRTDEIGPFTREQVDMRTDELGPVYGPLVVFVAETGLRTNEWIALEQKDVDRTGAVVVQRRFSQGRLTPYPKTVRSRRRIPLTARALDVVGALLPRIDTPLLFPAPEAVTSAWTRGARASGIPRSTPPGSPAAGPTAYATLSQLKHWPAASRRSNSRGLWARRLERIERTYGHLARDSEQQIRARLEARAQQVGVEWASDLDT